MPAVASASVAMTSGATCRQQQRCATPAGLRGLPAVCRPLRAGNTSSSKLERRAGRLHTLRTGCEGLPPVDRAALPPPPPVAPSSPSLLQRLARAGGAVALGAALVLGSAGAAEAARSGGRMGGGSFGGSRFSSSGGGFGGRSGFGAAAAMGGSSRLGSSFGSGFGSSTSGSGYRSSYKGGALTGGFGSPLPSTTGGVRVNSFFLSPWGFGYGVPVYGGFGGGGLLSLLFWGAFAVIMIQVLQGVLRGGSDSYQYGGGYTEGYEEVVTVGKVQVGLLGSARELQRDLERIADRADTESPEGLHYILQETVLALMRNPDYCLYGFAKSKRERCAEDAETAFNQLSLQERGKFQKETRTNVGGRSRRTSLAESKPYAVGDKELIVVTLLVAADGGFKLPQVTSRQELKEALSILGVVRADDLLAVEVLWTPEEEGDFFTVEDLAYDYPTLNTI
ncbi:hypothetical protein ABPG75_011229 [Micractinium tetrahymenae]